MWFCNNCFSQVESHKIHQETKQLVSVFYRPKWECGIMRCAVYWFMQGMWKINWLSVIKFGQIQWAWLKSLPGCVVSPFLSNVNLAMLHQNISSTLCYITAFDLLTGKNYKVVNQKYCSLPESTHFKLSPERNANFQTESQYIPISNTSAVSVCCGWFIIKVNTIFSDQLLWLAAYCLFIDMLHLFLNPRWL